MRTIRVRYVAVIAIIIFLLGLGFIMRLPFMTQVSANDVDISQVAIDENGTLSFSVEVQDSKWFAYSGQESGGGWIEAENGRKEKVIECCIHKRLKLGRDDKQKKTFSFELSDISEQQDISSVYFGRHGGNDRVLVWKKADY